MKLSISNIAWQQEDDSIMYQWMMNMGFTGLEIAPTRLFQNAPYEKLREAQVLSERLRSQYNIHISSMQSIWYGRSENIFGGNAQRDVLLSYTCQAIDFAVEIGCPNLVFGCPKNRNMPDGAQRDLAVDFFRKAGQYAADHQVVIAIEPNPFIYGTNFLNTTNDVLSFVQDVDIDAVKINLDCGAILENRESTTDVVTAFPYVHHVHISEPFLNPILKRWQHIWIRDELEAIGYGGYVSIEMKQTDVDNIKNCMFYIKNILGI